MFDSGSKPRIVWSPALRALFEPVLVVFLFLLLGGGSNALATPRYTREAELKPIGMSYCELGGIIRRIQGFVEQVNRTDEAITTVWRDRLSLEGDVFKLELSADYSDAAFENAPPVSQAVVYYYSCSPDTIPVAEVWLILSHDIRELKISGRSREQVDALFAMVSYELLQHSRFGGRNAIVLAVVLAGIVICGPLVAIRYFRERAYFLLAALVLLEFSCFALPLERWLPGAAVYQQSSSFSERHPDLNLLITVGLGLALFFLAPWYTKLFKKKRRNKRPATTAD